MNERPYNTTSPVDVDELNPMRPGVQSLQLELQDCGSRSPDGWDRLLDNDRVRKNEWDGQASDCRKHDSEDQPAMPFDGASDLRVYLADTIINDNVDLMTASFDRAFLRAHSSQPSDLGLGGVMTQMLTWYLATKQNVELNREKQLAANYLETYGWVAIQPTWQREVTRRLRRVELDRLLQALMDSDQEQAALTLGETIMDPSLEEQAMAMAQSVYQTWLRQEFADNEDLAPVKPLSKGRLRTLIRSLRETGVGELPVPMLTKNQPCIRALCPWRDVFIPSDLADMQRGRVYLREYLTEAELRMREQVDDYDSVWVQQALKTKGQVSIWTDNDSWQLAYERDSSSQLIEVWTAYTWRVDSDGVPGVFVTVFSAFFDSDERKAKTDLAAKHGLIDYDHGQVPIVAASREWIARSFGSARGTPELVWPLQRLEKVTLDGLVDRTSLTNLPPLLMDPKDIALGFKFAPLTGVPHRLGRQKPEPLALPRHDGAVSEVMAMAERKANDQFSRLHPEVLPVKTQVRQQRMVSNYLSLWEEVFQQEMALILQYCPPEQWESVTGEPKPDITPEQVLQEFRLMLTLNVGEFDLEYTAKMLDIIAGQILPADATGVIDRAKLTRLQLQAVNPVLARELVVDQGEASQKLYEQVKLDLAMMALGNPPQMVENDPTAATKMQYAGQIVQSNPNYQQALSQGGRFAELLQLYGKNLSQSVMQERNKTIGRIGVDPAAAS